MPQLRLYVILGAVGAVLIALTTYGLYLYHAGEKVMQANQAIAQLKHDKKIRKAYDTIDQQTPYGSDNASVAAFLLSHTSSGR